MSNLLYYSETKADCKSFVTLKNRYGTNADVYQHNTMALPGHIHLIVLMGPVIMGLGLIYLVTEDVNKKKLSKALGEIHFWLTVFGGFGFALLFTIIGMEGAIRREANMPSSFDWAMPLLLFFALCIGIAQLLFIYSVISILKKKPIENAQSDRPLSKV